MVFPKDILRAQALEYGLALTEVQLGKLECYAETLVEWNEKMNLTAITAPEEIAVKHFLDSLLLLSAVELPKGAALIDVGTGAGFPSLPCKLVREDLQVTLLDSLNKRVTFLKALCAALGVEAAAIHARAEEGGRMPQLRERFDVATARAVANLRELAEYCLPFVKVGGVFVALKGYEIEEELEAAKKGVRELGGRVRKVEKYCLPDESRRSIIVIEKISQTALKYPRPSAKIAKAPL